MSVRSRTGSFILSDDEVDEMIRPQTLKSLLELLKGYFSETMSEEIFDKAFNESMEKKNKSLYNIPLIRKVRPKYKECCEVLSNVRLMMLTKLKQKTALTNDDYWDAMTQDFNTDHYLVFIYCLMRLIDFDLSDNVNQELSFAAGRTYIVLLSSPGAKRCEVFDHEFIIKYLKIFDYMPQMRLRGKLSDFQYLAMMDELQIVFQLVGLNDQDLIKKHFINTIKKVIQDCLTSNHSNPEINEIIIKGYQLLEVLCLPCHGNIEDNLMMIFRSTFSLHFVASKRRNFVMPTSVRYEGENIWDFFIYLLNCYYESATNVLKQFIKSLLSNPEQISSKQTGNIYRVAAKYEFVLHWKFNDDSVFEYLKQIVKSSDHKQRSSGIEFLGAMLTINSTPDPSEETESDNTTAPREVEILKIIFKHINDKVDSVKLKVLSVVKAALELGNSITKQVLVDSLKRKEQFSDSTSSSSRLSNERRNFASKLRIMDSQSNTSDKENGNTIEEDPTSSTSKSNEPAVEKLIPLEEVNNFKNGLLILIQTCKQVYPKKYSIELLEVIGNLDEEFVNDKYFSEIILNVADDPSQMVKSAGIEIMNKFLKKYSKNTTLIELWVDMILCMLKDDDQKIVDSAIKSLVENLFNKVESYENSSADNNMPWVIMNAILVKGKRNVVLKALNKSMKGELLNKKQLEKIETNVYSSNSVEGWALLSLIARNIKSKNTDIVVKRLLDMIENSSFDDVNIHLILEIVVSWMDQFSKSALVQIVSNIEDVLINGKSNITIIQFFYSTYKLGISRLFPDQPKQLEGVIESLHNYAKNYLIANIDQFHDPKSYDGKLLNFLMLYGETTTDLPARPAKQIMSYLFGFLKGAQRKTVQYAGQRDLPRKTNMVITLLTRFAIRDYEIAAQLSPMLGQLLSHQELPISVVKNIMISLNDLCKKHTATVEPIMKDIVQQLKSPFEEVRICTLENIYDLILQDYIKLRGRVLLYVLASLVDPNENVSLKATALILNYAYDKNQNLLQSCFIESVFVLNGYHQFEDFGVFPVNELDNETTILKGDDKQEARYQLYEFFCRNIHDMNEVQLLMLFRYIITINDKLKKKQLVRTRNGINAFRDLLYCFKLICEKREESRSKIEKTTTDENSTGVDDLDNDLPIAEVVDPTAASTSKKQPKINQNLPTMKDATQLVEKVISIYPNFVKSLKIYDASLTTNLNLLSKAIAKNFKNLVQYAKPAYFWNEFRKGSSKPRKRNRITSENSDSETEDLDLD